MSAIRTTYERTSRPHLRLRLRQISSFQFSLGNRRSRWWGAAFFFSKILTSSPLIGQTLFVALISAACGVGIGAAAVGRAHASADDPRGGPVGVWFATFPDAPFKYHM